MSDIATLAADLVQQTVAARERMHQDPFGNSVLDLSLMLSRSMDDGSLPLDRTAALIRELRDQAFAGRARKLAAYVGGAEADRSAAAMTAIGERLCAGSIEDFQRETETIRFSAVFTAHPTFSMPWDVGRELAAVASGAEPGPSRDSHRPSKPALAEEFDQAVAAIKAGRDAIDGLSEALLTAAREKWPDRWTRLTPKPVVLASWVGYDTDGRTDINWWDTIRLRLQMKAMQLERVAAQVGETVPGSPLHERLKSALAAVEAQMSACPQGAAADPAAVAEFARTLVERRDEALVTTAPLMALFEDAIASAPVDAQMGLCVARAGLLAHGLSLSHTQFRLNASQLHNALRQQANLDDAVGDASRRRAMLSAINGALDRLEPSAVDFGALLTETSSASRLMMTMAQILKHVDAETPVRFHIAETENGYTLLCALWLARLFGIDDRVEISPLFETADALERGARVLDEALRSRHFRDYLGRIGSLALEFGYSDSGRYVGQLAASYMIERLRMRIADALARHDMQGVALIVFDTHGESIGRGAHPGALSDRLKFLNPTRSRKELKKAGIELRSESAFQGGDGYLLFGTGALALATVARIAEHVFDENARPDARLLPPDPVYDDPDFSADFFGAMRAAMEALVEEPGYAALLGTFGPALLDPSGSRPSARQVDGLGGPAAIKHPRELRAIPNNAILQQLGWCANTLHGFGAALSRHPQAFHELIGRSPRFRRAIDFIEHGLTHSDLDVLRAVVSILDPGSWLNRAEHETEASQRAALMEVSEALERLGMSSAAYAMLRRVQMDHLALRSVWRDSPVMAPQELLLHAIRIALVQRIWLLAMRVPDFSPRFGVTRRAIVSRILRLDVEASLDALATIFPAKADDGADRDYFEPRGRRVASAYEREHTEVFQPIGELFALVREVSTAVTHSVGAFG